MEWKGPGRTPDFQAELCCSAHDHRLVGVWKERGLTARQALFAGHRNGSSLFQLRRYNEDAQAQPGTSSETYAKNAPCLLIFIDLYFFFGILLPVGFLGGLKMQKILLICLLSGCAVAAQAVEEGDQAAKASHVKHHHHKHHKAAHHKHHAHHHVHRKVEHATAQNDDADQSARVAAILDDKIDPIAAAPELTQPAAPEISPMVQPVQTFAAAQGQAATEVPEIQAKDISAPDETRFAAKYDTQLNFFQPRSKPKLRSSYALVFDEEAQRPLYTKNPDAVTPIASITKLMTAMVVLDSNPNLDEEISVSDADKDYLKRTHSRLGVGTTFTRREMLNLALMSSENRAASALARNYPGGTSAAIAAMNAKARALGMTNTVFHDPTGLNSQNVSTARDLVKMVAAARKYNLIHQFTTTASRLMEGQRGRELLFNNTNPLVKSASWQIGLSKTGFINEAGRCLVMQAKIRQRPIIIVLLDSVGKSSRIGDANRVKKWIENANMRGGYASRG
jgi:D-alanyl-D-alanine endopeptidase (penicillin-binding protein 7)